MQKSGLEIYAKIEDLLGVKEAAPKLYKEYLKLLQEIEFDSILDIGCGSGDFLALIDSLTLAKKTLGIDISVEMVQKALEKGVNAKVAKINEVEDKFDVALAIFDMVNYLKPKEIKKFFTDVAKAVKKEGYFIFDINSYFALSTLAVGNFIAQDENRFIAIESFFEDGVYESYFTLFNKKENNCFHKEEGVVFQYYYEIDFFKNLEHWKLIRSIPMKLYEMESVDKYLLMMQRV